MFNNTRLLALPTERSNARLLIFLISSALILVFAASMTYGQTPQDLNDLPANGFEVPASTINNESQQPASTTRNETSSDQGQIVASRRLLEVVRNGGPLMIPIGICSFILVVFVFERLISLRKGSIIPGPFTKRFLDQLREGELNREAATALCDRNNSPMAKVFRAGIQKWGRPSVEVEQAVLDEGERSSNHLRKYLRLINGIATLCPLLGLLGTVLGMIHAFDAIATVTGNVDPKTLIATGISQALLTTAAGMSVAIPALIAYLFFTSRVDRHVMEIDTMGMKVVHLVSAEAISANQHASKKAA